jgi:hypothetical protein
MSEDVTEDAVMVTSNPWPIIAFWIAATICVLAVLAEITITRLNNDQTTRHLVETCLQQGKAVTECRSLR